MIVRELEGLIKNTLSQYKTDYNTIEDSKEIEDKGRKIDFNVTFSRHVMDTSEIPGYDPNDPRFAAAKKYDGKPLMYLRVVKTILGVNELANEKRVIYTGYRPSEEFNDKESIKRSLLMECLKNLMLAGIEYSEAMYIMNVKSQEDAVESES
jgi:hypothetical protein